MMKYEFENIAGYRVSEEDYNKIIEPMYNATDLDKIDFVKVIDRKRFEIKEEKTAEQLALEKQLNAELGMLKADVEWYESRIEMYKNYLGDEDQEYWKNEIKSAKNQISHLKNRIKSIKWVLA